MLIFRAIIALGVYIAGIFLVNPIVIAILNKVCQCEFENSKKGKAIGILERFLIITTISPDQFALLYWAIATEALAVYQYREELSSEYTFIGTCPFSRSRCLPVF